MKNLLLSSLVFVEMHKTLFIIIRSKKVLVLIKFVITVVTVNILTLKNITKVCVRCNF